MEENQRKRLKKINGVSFRRHLKKNSAKIILTVDIPLKLLYEKEENWKNGKKIENNEFGALPNCCKPLPKKEALYLCRCEKHIVRIAGFNNPRISKSLLVQVGEIPEKMSHNYLCKRLCK
jgi:hypothetical protein